jgi:hypothetical protein
MYLVIVMVIVMVIVIRGTTATGIPCNASRQLQTFHNCYQTRHLPQGSAERAQPAALIRGARQQHRCP